MHFNMSVPAQKIHPIVKSSFFDEKNRFSSEIDLLFCLYHAMPDNSPRLEKSRAATHRIQIRKRTHILPPREAFETTVDFYEAAMPLLVARSRFTAFCHVDNYLRCVQKALLSVIPAKLF
jgi:hypothetical protein